MLPRAAAKPGSNKSAAMRRSAKLHQQYEEPRSKGYKDVISATQRLMLTQANILQVTNELPLLRPSSPQHSEHRLPLQPRSLRLAALVLLETDLRD